MYNHNNRSLTEVMGIGNTIKGVWTPRHYHGHHHHGHHHHGNNHPPTVDWNDTPNGQCNNAFIVNLGYLPKAFHPFLNVEINSGDIVFFGPEGTIIRYLPFKTSGNSDVTVSPDDDNALIKTLNGLKVPKSLYGAGEGIEITPDNEIRVYVDSDPDNAVQIQDGVYVRNSELHFHFNGVTGEPELVFQDNTDNPQQIINLNALVSQSIPNDGQISISSDGNIEVQNGSFTVNQAGNTNVNLKLSNQILSDIQDGVTALNTINNINMSDYVLKSELEAEVLQILQGMNLGGNP